MKLNQKGFGLIEGLLIVIALTLVVFVGFYVYNANKEESQITDSSIQPRSNSTEEPAVVEEQKTLPELVDYGEEGIEVAKKAEVNQLYDTSDSFKEFIASYLGEQPKKVEGCGEEMIIVNKIYKDTFADGSTTDGCGGAKLIWAKVNDVWEDTKLGGHSYPTCSDVAQYEVPKVILNKCYNESSGNLVNNSY